MSRGEPIDWQADGTARSPRFGQAYSSCGGGVAQALTVFLGGCALPERWRGRDSFTVLETGFGMGLNFLTTWAVWQADPQRCATLNYVAVEAYPVSAQDLLHYLRAAGAAGVGEAQLLARLALLGEELCAVWPRLAAGVNVFEFAQPGVRLTLVVDQVQAALASVPCVADAVYLDGFSPAVNPDMWSHATLASVAAHAGKGTLLASYTVARQVRDTLKALGFSVSKLKGLPPKRDRLQAVFTGAP